jgi:hypothetical protein
MQKRVGKWQDQRPPELFPQAGGKILHRDVGLSLHCADQKGLVARQLAAAARPTLAHWSWRNAPLLVLDQLDRKALADPKPPGGSAPGMALSHKGRHSLAKIYRVAASMIHLLEGVSHAQPLPPNLVPVSDLTRYSYDLTESRLQVLERRLRRLLDQLSSGHCREVAEDLTNADTRTAARDRMQAQFKGAQLGEIKAKAIEELRSVAALVDAKAPQDAPSFKAWLREVAQRAAEAGKEGGFMGFGGVAVSDAERATLAEISAALGTGTSPG